MSRKLAPVSVTDLTLTVVGHLAVIIEGNGRSRNGHRGHGSPALKLDGVEVDTTLLLLSALLVLRQSDLDLGGSTTLVVLDGVAAGAAASDLLAGGAVLHLVVELDILLLVVERDIDLADGEVFLVTANLVAELFLLDLGGNAAVLWRVSDCGPVTGDDRERTLKLRPSKLRLPRLVPHFQPEKL